MRFYTRQHRHCCGIGLHGRTMYPCVLSHDGGVLPEQDPRCDPALFLRAIEPYGRTFLSPWSASSPGTGSAGRCAREHIPFVPVHAPCMKAIHGGKATNDRINAIRSRRCPVAG